MIATHAVGRAATGIAHQSAGHGFGLHPRVQLVLWIERRLARTVFDQLQCQEQSAPPDIPDVTMIAEARLQGGAQRRALRPHPLQQTLAFNGVLYGQAAGTGCRMTYIGETVLETAGAAGQGLDNLP